MIADMIPEEPYEPRTSADVLRHNSREKWLQAANSKMASLTENNTWTLVDPPPNRTILKGKWVFKYKRDATG
jgi:hypothetical protein